MRIRLVNPNTTASMTDTAARAARLVAAPGTIIEPATSSMGRRRSKDITTKPWPCQGFCSKLAARG
jgi:Asp/Glu/hydantoin racemase